MQFKTVVSNLGQEFAYLNADGLRQVLGGGRQALRRGGAVDRQAGISLPSRDARERGNANDE